MTKEIYLHIGTYKTGTKTLQKALVDHLPGAAVSLTMDDFLGKYHRQNNQNRFIDIPAYCSDLLQCVTLPETEPYILSCEMLMNTPFAGGQFFPRLLSLLDAVRYFIAHQFRVHLLLVVRNPFDFLESWYLQLLSTASYNGSFVQYVEQCVTKPFSWSWIASSLADTGAALTVLPYEMLLKDRHAFTGAVNGFFDKATLFSDEDFDLFVHKTFSKDIYGLFRKLGEIEDKDLANRVVRLVHDAFEKDYDREAVAHSNPHPDLSCPLILQGMRKVLDVLDRDFARTYLSRDQQMYYLG